MTPRRAPLRCINNLNRESVTSERVSPSKFPLKKQCCHVVSIADLLRKSSREQRGVEGKSSLDPSEGLRSASVNSTLEPRYSLFDDNVPEELSTFFESSRVEDLQAKSLRPRCVGNENFFPEDILFNNIPWLGIKSPTFSRKRKIVPEICEVPPDTTQLSSDTEEEEIETVKRCSPRKRRKRTTDDPEFKAWLEKVNKEFDEISQQELTVEESW